MVSSPNKRKRRKKKNNRHGIKPKSKSKPKGISKSVASQFLKKIDQTKNDETSYLTQEKLKMLPNPMCNKNVDEIKPLLTWTFYNRMLWKKVLSVR